jgi:UDP-2,3-diacylglucosamine pyrophosphatase LpxH
MTEFNTEKLQGETNFRHLVRLAVGKLNKEHSMDWLELVDQFKLDYSAETLRKKAYGWKDFVENEEIEQLNSEEEITYKETTEILANGSHKSDKLLQMSAEDSKDVDYLLAAHGFDNSDWELVNAKNNIWNVYSKKDGVQSLYSSKITVKPKVSGFDIDKLVERMSQREPIIIEKESASKHSKLLEISLYDMHFGISSLEYYQNHLEEIAHKIRSRSWEKILFVIGQDLLHNDNFKGQTANGTQIDKVNMEKAFDEAVAFYETLIKEALVKSNEIECIYVKGNHDESISYGLFRTLKATFPQVSFEGSLKQRKGFVWEKIFIGLTHGDKGANRLMENFLSEYGKLIAQAEVKEIHAGHLHTEITKDKFGIVQRTLATANKTDEWHDDNGFVGANKRFQLFEYSPTTLDAIYYIQ